MAGAVTQNPVSADFQSLPSAPSWPMSEITIPLTQVDLGRDGLCMLLRAPYANCIGLAQPANWSTLCDGWAGDHDALAGPVVIWMVGGSIPPLPTSQGGFESTAPCVLSETDRYYPADGDGDGL